MAEPGPDAVSAQPDRLPIGAVAEQVGLQADTLRYYERNGVLPAPHRDSAGRRWYRPDDVHLIEVLLHLKATGMPLARIAEFTALVASDPAGVPERLALLCQHREQVQRQVDSWRRSLTIIDGKIDDYRRRLPDSVVPDDAATE